MPARAPRASPPRALRAAAYVVVAVCCVPAFLVTCAAKPLGRGARDPALAIAHAGSMYQGLGRGHAAPAASPAEPLVPVRRAGEALGQEIDEHPDLGREVAARRIDRVHRRVHGAAPLRQDLPEPSGA